MQVFVASSDRVRGSLTRYGSWLLVGVLLMSLGVMAQQSPRQNTSGRERVPGASKNPQVVPREMLIKFRPGVTQRQRLSILKSVDAQPVRHFPMFDIYHVRLLPEANEARAFERLRRNSNVLYAEPNHRISLRATPNDPRFRELWGLHNTGQTIQGQPGTPNADINAPEAWDISTGSRSIIVAVFDTGIDYNHPDLRANVWTNPLDGTHGYNAIAKTNDPRDDDGHGTHVAGTVGAVGNNGIGVVGVNWSVQLLGIKILDAFGGSLADAIDGLNWMLDQKVNKGQNIRVANHSWGFTGFNQALKDAFDVTAAAGITHVCAAGNTAFNNDIIPDAPSGFDTPGLIAVAASDNNDNPASFTNYGATTVDLAAPGVSVLSTVPTFANPSGYDFFDGTSMASPHVAGACALVLSLDPTLTVDALRTAILNGVDKLPQWSLGSNRPVLSEGRLNVVKVVSNFANPDLTISFFTVSNAARGTQTTVKAIVLNSGRAITTPFRVDFYKNRSTPPPVGVPGDISQVINGLPTGGTRTLTFTFPATTFGTSKGWLQVDTLSQVTERNEANNVMGPADYQVADAVVFDAFNDSDGKRLLDHLPDINLPVDHWALSPPSLPPSTVQLFNNEARVNLTSQFVRAVIDTQRRDGALEVDMRVGTTGLLYGGVVFRQSDDNNYFAVRLDSSAPEGEGLSLIKVQEGVGRLLARKDFRMLRGTSYHWRVELVDAKITVFIDGAKHLEVTDTFNLNATKSGILWFAGRGGEQTAFDNFAFFVDQPTQPVLPDLTVQSVSISPTASVPGTPLTATIVVRNDGTDTGGSFSVDFYENLSSAPGAGRTGNKRFTISSLGQGATTTLTYTFTPSNSGNYQAWVQVDTDAQVRENHEGNNVTGPIGYIVANAVVQDTFSDRDGTVLGPGASDHLPDVSPSGGRWDSVGSVKPIVHSGEARLPSSGTGLVTAFINAGVSNGTIDVDTRMFSSSLLFSGVVFRRTDANNYFFARADSSDTGRELGVARVQNGVTTFLGRVPFALTSGRTYRWHIQLSGAVIRVFFDGQLRFEVNDSFNQAATQSGLLWNAASGGQNTAFDNFLVTGTPQPELVIQSLTLTPLFAAPGTPLTATVRVKNQGSADASAFVVDFYQNSATPPGAVPGDARQTVTSLAAGATTILTFNFSQAAEGNYQAWAQVDTDGAVAEINETNNVFGPLPYAAVTVIPENVKDSFTGADGTSLTAHAPDVNKPGGTWNVSGLVGVTIQGNQVKPAGVAGGFVTATINGGAANATIDVDTTFGSSGLLFSGVVFRQANENNYFIARADSSDVGGELALVRVQNGSGTYLGRRGRTLIPGSTVHWRVVLSNGRIEVFFGDMLNPVFSVTDEFNKSATAHGVQWFAANGGENTTFDNFAVTPGANPLGGGGGRGRRFSPGLYLLSLPVGGQVVHLPSGVKLARWNNVSGTVETSGTPVLRSGEGYWAQFTHDTTLTAPSVGTAQPFTFLLDAGWNLIGYPFLTPMALDGNGIRVRDITTGVVTTLSDAVHRGWLDEVMWTYQGSEGYRPVHPTLPGALHTLEPWQGYFVKATQPLQLTLPAPDSVPTFKRANVRTPTLNNWSLTLTVRDGSGQDSCVLGVSSTAGGDGVALKPPPAPQTAPSVYFPASGLTPYAVSLRQSVQSGAEWDVEVLPSPVSATVTLDWSNLTGVPKNVRLTLVDVETGKRYYMRTQSGLTLPVHGAVPRRFKLIASTDVSGRRLLSALNATGGRSSGPLLVSFVLGSEAHVTLEVLSPTGKVISRPLGATRRSAGLNTLAWDGKDPMGRVTPRGVYLLRVTAIDDEGRTMSLTQPVTLGR
ncbi:MAG: S8 family serine peptidase [Abditibacteriales bacterium]|nr:S8 family serine peptidase [Abditibacteriales bacterium]